MQATEMQLLAWATLNKDKTVTKHLKKNVRVLVRVKQSTIQRLANE